MGAPVLKFDQKNEDRIIARITQIVSVLTGNQFGERQKTMVVTRLRNRLMKLGLTSFAEYEVFFEKHEQAERQALISLLTTHHTFFFRETSHFEFLESQALPALIEIARKRPDKTIRVWSAACSGGHEVYSLAMCLSQALKMMAPDVKFHILGTDIDSESVRLAENGVYNRSEIKEVPLAYVSEHWAKGSGDISDFYKAKKSLRSFCKFEILNLLQLKNSKRIEKFDVIFCRNVFIYFNALQIKEISSEFLKALEPSGFLFVGKSESLNGIGLEVKSLGPSIYTHLVVQSKLQSVVHSKTSTSSQSVAPEAKSLSANAGRLNTSRIPFQPEGHSSAVTSNSSSRVPSVIKVFSIDDSPVILKMMKQIFSVPGFEWIGSAINGKDAAEKLRTIKPDIITLDIHMPEMDGLTYLKTHFNSHHPPVVMVSSVSRENADLAFRALEYGASDYVEKPALSNLKEKSDEMRSKVKVAIWNKKLQKDLTVEKKFTQSNTIIHAADCLQIVILNFSDRDKVSSLVESFPALYPPTLFAIEGAGDALVVTSQALQSGATIKFNDMKNGFQPSKYYVTDALNSFQSASRYAKQKVSVFVLGRTSEKLRQELEKQAFGQVLLEEMTLDLHSDVESEWKFVSDTSPVTSFSYLSTEYFSKVK